MVRALCARRGRAPNAPRASIVGGGREVPEVAWRWATASFARIRVPRAVRSWCRRAEARAPSWRT
eukprot:14591932-Alexandrium_andersonii.AAC.1